MQARSCLYRPPLGLLAPGQRSQLFKALDLSWIPVNLGAFVLMFIVFWVGVGPGIAKAEDPRFSFAFGSKGSGNGQFVNPYDMAIDSTGNFWVVDSGNSRIQKFNAKGEYLAKFGTEGFGNGQFIESVGIAIDSGDNLWISDIYSNRIQKFNAKGEYLAKFGTEGSGDGQFSWPMGMAIDSTGNLWVVDSTNHRVQKFNSKGEYLSQFGAQGSGNGQFQEPANIAIDSTGNLWVVDSGNNRVQRFNSKGEYLSQFGTKGSGSGQFLFPFGLVVDSTDDVWVSDVENTRIQKWIPNRPTTKTEAANEVTTSAATMRGTVNPNGLETTYRFEIGTTSEYGFSVPAEDKGIGSGKSGVEVSEKLVGLKSGTTYHFRVVATNAEGTSYGKDETFTTK